MARYILIPDASTRKRRSVSLAGRQTDRASRQRQIAEARATAGEGSHGVKAWVDRQAGAKKLTHSEQTTPITGAQIVDLPEGAVLPPALGYNAIPDMPLSLIRPVRPAADGAGVAAAQIDPWHLDVIGLMERRAAGFNGTGKGVTVAVLDTGIDATHPEIAHCVKSSYTFDVSAWKVNQQGTIVDTDGHGTHVCGLIAGKNVGVAPDASVLSGIMIPNGDGMLSDFLLALEWAAANPEVQIINVSAGIPGLIPGFDDIFQQVAASGVLLVCAVGNEGRDRSRSPGNYRDALSVGAVDKQRKIAGFSGGGLMNAVDGHTYTVPDLVAPGAGVFSCVQGGLYEAWDGTSMATPIVSGIAALLLEQQPLLPVGDVVERILSGCTNLNLQPTRQGVGVAQVL